MKAATFAKGVLVVSSLTVAALCPPAGLVAGIFLGASAATGGAAVALGALGAVIGGAVGIAAGGLASWPARSILSARASRTLSKIVSRLRRPDAEQTPAARLSALSLKNAFETKDQGVPEAQASVFAPAQGAACKPE